MNKENPPPGLAPLPPLPAARFARGGRESAQASRIFAILKRIASCATAFIILATTAAHAAEDDARIKQLTAAYRASGQALFARLAAEPGNIVFSPYSVGTAMAMAFAGAGGDTAAEMARVLRLGMNRADVDAANGALIKILNGYDRSAAPPACTAGMTWNGKDCEGPAAAGRCPVDMRKDAERRVGAPTHVAASAKLAGAHALMLPGQGDAI